MTDLATKIEMARRRARARQARARILAERAERGDVRGLTDVGAASSSSFPGEGEPATAAGLSEGSPPLPHPTIPAVTDARFGTPPLPSRFTAFRDVQWQGIEEAVAAFDDGVKVVFMDAPTGTGKSLVGETIRRLVGGSAVYIAPTKHLQDQMLDSFPYAVMLKGRANYIPAGAEQVDLWGRVEGPKKKTGATVTCADCTRTPNSACRWCDDEARCPYTVAKNTALQADLAVLNTAYFLTDSNVGSRKFTGRDLVIIDEADTLEAELMGLVEVRITKARQRMLQLEPPPKKTVEETWGPWVDQVAIPRVAQALSFAGRIEDARDARQIREIKALKNLLEGLRLLNAELAADPGSWVYDGYQQGEIVFKPVRVSKWGDKYLWKHGARFLLMSASTISAQEMAESLGLSDSYAVVDVPMTFPVENRQVKVVPVAEMTNKQADTAWPKMAYALARVLELHPGERVLVHTVSYKLADYLWTEARKADPSRPVFRYSGSGEKDDALKRYLASEGGVMIAPSMDRGVDLPGDACRVQVIAKVPFPNLGDKQVAKRMHTQGGQEWYAVQTVRTLVQMTGRGVRSAEDHAVTYILDHSFTSNVWRRSKNLLPKWWVDALYWREDPRRFIAPAPARSA